MPKPSSGSNRYLKAQLRPLTKPVFWASASLFGLSIFVLINLFRQPDAVLSSGDPNAVVSLDENDSLTPEERARAAEIDDLSVLLRDLDKSKTIESVSGQPNDIQTANLEIPEAIANLETSKPTNLPTTNNNQFQQLPLLNLSPQNPDNRGQTPGSSGFIGFDPRASAQVNGLTSPSSTNTNTPLAAALEQNSGAATTTSQSDSRATSRSTFQTGTASNNENSGTVTTATEANGTPNSFPLATSSQISTSPQTYTFPQERVATQNSNNPYNQALTSNLATPTAPASPTLISPISPAQPAQPSTASTVINLGPIPTRQSSEINLSPSTSTASQSPVFETAPSPSVAAPTASNPAPFSVPNNTPGRFIGNGEINTFANP